jgi:hypothetical protein
MPSIGIGPRDGLAAGRRLERALLRLGRETLVALIERIAGESTQQRAARWWRIPSPRRRGA